MIMARNAVVRMWAGVCLALLVLGASGGCCSWDGCGALRPHFYSLAGKEVCRGPMTCGPCFGYHPTCWLSWPECCGPCPPPEHLGPIPAAPTSAVPAEADLAPVPGREPVPRPKAESSKEKPPRPIPPPAPPTRTSSRRKTDTADWGVAPMPDDILSDPLLKSRRARSPVHAVAFKQEERRSRNSGDDQ